MAVLQQPTNTFNPFADVIGDDLAPAGTYVATVLDVHDEFGVQRQKYQSEEMEMVDLTTFLFGLRDAAGQPHRVASRRMRISGNEKSALFAFLKGMLGRAPQYGWDYATLKGSKCLLTVEHVQRRDGMGVFAGIAALSPVPAGFGGDAVAAPVTQPVAQPMPAAARGAGDGALGDRALPSVPSPAPAAAAVAAPAVAEPWTGDDAIPF